MKSNETNKTHKWTKKEKKKENIQIFVTEI